MRKVFRNVMGALLLASCGNTNTASTPADASTTSDARDPALCLETTTLLTAVPKQRSGFKESPPALVARAVGVWRTARGDSLTITETDQEIAWIERAHNPKAPHTGSNAPECPSELRVPVDIKLDTEQGEHVIASGYLSLEPWWMGWIPAQLIFDVDAAIAGYTGPVEGWGRLDGVAPEADGGAGSDDWDLLIRPYPAPTEPGGHGEASSGGSTTSEPHKGTLELHFTRSQ